MLPVESGVIWGVSGIVHFRLDMSREDRADARAVATAAGPDDAGGRGRAVRAPTRGDRTHQLPDRAAGGRGAPCSRDRLARPTWAAPGPQSPATVPGRG